MIRHEPCIVIKPYIKELTIEKYQSGIKLIYLKSSDQNTIHIDIDNNDMVWDTTVNWQITNDDNRDLVNYIYAVLGNRLQGKMNMITNYGMKPQTVDSTNFKEIFSEHLHYLLHINSVVEFIQKHRDKDGKRVTQTPSLFQLWFPVSLWSGWKANSLNSSLQDLKDE